MEINYILRTLTFNFLSSIKIMLFCDGIEFLAHNVKKCSVANRNLD